MPQRKNHESKESLRLRAEKLLLRPEKDTRKLSHEELEQLSHELSIHQIELEIQNQDLRETQEKLLAARDRYAELYNFASVAYVTLDANYLIVEANLTFKKLLSLSETKDQSLRHRLIEYIVPDSHDKFHFFFSVYSAVWLMAQKQSKSVCLRPTERTLFMLAWKD